MIDPDLNIQNASQKGLVWVKDTLYTPFIAQEVEKLMSNGYCLGKPGNPTSSNIVVGIYTKKNK